MVQGEEEETSLFVYRSLKNLSFYRLHLCSSAEVTDEKITNVKLQETRKSHACSIHLSVMLNSMGCS